MTDTPSERFVGQPAQRVVSTLQFSVFDEGFGERVLAGSGLETSDEESGRYVAAFDGAAYSLELIRHPVRILSTSNDLATSARHMLAATRDVACWSMSDFDNARAATTDCQLLKTQVGVSIQVGEGAAGHAAHAIRKSPGSYLGIY